MLLPTWLVLPYLVVFATIAQALLVSAKVLPPSCAQCGLPLERRRLGQTICGCGNAQH
jgi:uncharacterized Zn finger protein (UPF0148 family)